MYTLSTWRICLVSVVVDLLFQKPAKTVGDPFKAFFSWRSHRGIEDNQCIPFVLGDVTWVIGMQKSRMTKVHAKFLEKSPGYRGSRPIAPETRQNRGGPVYSLCS